MSIDLVVGPLHCRSITYLSSDFCPVDRTLAAHAAEGGGGNS